MSAIVAGTRWRGTTRQHPHIVQVLAVRTRSVRLARRGAHATHPRGQWLPTAVFLRFYAPLGRREG